MNSREKSKRIQKLEIEADKIDQQLAFMEAMEEWSDSDGNRYDELVKEREWLQDQIDELIGA